MRFTKVQGLGNDFILVNGLEEELKDLDFSGLAVEMCNRHFGVGADGLVLLLPSDRADIYMRIFNSDGSEAEMCGNAIRCVAKYLYERGLVRKEKLRWIPRLESGYLNCFWRPDGFVQSGWIWVNRAWNAMRYP